ncbi:MAG: sulfurtransferase [Chloroflexota bacterium]
MSANVSSALVSPEWARQHLDDPGVRFVEVDFGTESYVRNHLPGAVGWDWNSQLCDGLRRDIAGRESLSRLLSQSGIGPDTQITLYGEDNWYAAWACWQLKLYGVRNVSLIDGGREYWLEHRLPLSTTIPSYHQTEVELPEPDFSTRAFQQDIAAQLGQPDLAMVDVRLPVEYSGEAIAPPGYPDIAQRGGHIPGAVSIPWDHAVHTDGTFKSVDELSAHYAKAGVTDDRDIVTYCGVGVRSSHTWFVLHELLGYPNVRNYDGSWAEWGSLIGAPIEISPPR